MFRLYAYRQYTSINSDFGGYSKIQEHFIEREKKGTGKDKDKDKEVGKKRKKKNLYLDYVLSIFISSPPFFLSSFSWPLSLLLSSPPFFSNIPCRTLALMPKELMRGQWASLRKKAYLPTNQSTNYSIDRATNPPISQAICQSIDQPSNPTTSSTSSHGLPLAFLRRSAYASSTVLVIIGHLPVRSVHARA